MSLSKDTRGDLDPEWRRDAEFHNSTVGDPLQTSPNERDEFVNQEVFDAYCCGMRVSSSGLWKVDKAAVESGARGEFFFLHLRLFTFYVYGKCTYGSPILCVGNVWNIRN